MRGASYVELGAFLEKKREAIGFSKAALGRIVGVTGPAIGMFEFGEKRPSATTLARVLRALEITEDELEQVGRLSGYRFTMETINKAVLDTGWLEKSAKITDDLPLVQLMDQFGVRDIAIFLGDMANEQLIFTILEIQREREVPLDSKVIQRLVMMGRVTKLTLPVETWKIILASLEKQEATVEPKEEIGTVEEDTTDT